MKPNEISYNIYNPLYVEKNMDQYVRSKMSSESFITPLRVIPQNKDDKIRNQINYLEQRIYSPPPKESYQSPPQQVYQNQRQPQNYFLDPPFTNQLPLKYYPPTYSNVVDYSKNRPKQFFPEYEPNYYPQPIDNAIGDYTFVNQQNYNINNNNNSNFNQNYHYDDGRNNNIYRESNNVNINVNERNFNNDNNFRKGFYQQKIDDFSIQSNNEKNRIQRQDRLYDDYKRRVINNNNGNGVYGNNYQY